MKSSVIWFFSLTALVWFISDFSNQELRAGSESIAWDFGPTTGYPSDGVNYFTNQEGVQTLWDSNVFPTSTLVSGFNLFTSPFALPLQGNLFRVRFRLDDRGLPGVTFAQRDVIAQAVHFVGNFASPEGPASVYQISLAFSPVTLAAGTTYWVGATSVGFECGQYGVVGAGDGRMAMQGGGSGLPYIWTSDGDLMFQLVAAVPEPASSAFLVLGISGYLLVRRAGKSKRG